MLELVCGKELLLGVVLGRRRRRVGRKRLIVVVYAAGLEFVLKKRNKVICSTPHKIVAMQGREDITA